MNRSLLRASILATALLVLPAASLAVGSRLQISQYDHTSWTSRDGYTPGLVFAIAQTPDGYLWLAGEFGLFRFDGIEFRLWQPPAGRSLPHKPYSLLVSRDGTLWIGTFEGLVSWNGVELTDYPQVEQGFVTSLLEDRDGTIWAGILATRGRLCAVRDGQAKCHLNDGRFGGFVWSLAEDDAGRLWVGADSGLWRWQPGPPQRHELTGMRPADLVTAGDGKLLVGVRGGGLMRFKGDELEHFPLGVPGRDVRANKLLRDRDGGVWIGTDGRGLFRLQDGEVDTFAKANGLSGNIACSLFEDREGNIWYASERGLDRFRKLPVTTISEREGLSSDTTRSVLASVDGSVWLATNDGVTRWQDSKPVVYGTGSGLPDRETQSLYEDFRGRIWVSTNRGLAYFERGRFVAVPGMPSKEAASITGDDAGNLWLSGNDGLVHFHDGRFVDSFPWSGLGRRQWAKVIVADQGGVWLSFWLDGGVSYFKDGRIQANYTAADGLGAGHISGLRLDRERVLWAATEAGGLSRIHDGRIITLTTRNGLPCNAVHWSMEDDHRSLWLYTACGLLRITGDDLSAWVADPSHEVAVQQWGPADGIRLRSVTPAYFNPPVAKTADGKLWSVLGEGVQVIDPDHLASNEIPPSVHIEQVIADRMTYPAAKDLRLPARVRDVTIGFSALTLVDPRNVPIRYRLEGHDSEWQEAVGRRQVFYTNLPPGAYRFHVTAANNSGVWNVEGAQLAFFIAPALYQSTWFRLAGVVLVTGLIWAGIQMRVHRVRREEKRLRDVIEGIPAMAFSVNPDGSPDLVNQRWLEYSGLSVSANRDARAWESAIHPDDVGAHLARWRAALASGEPFESEARHRSASGEYRWFYVQAVPLRDNQGRIVKWYGTLTDIEERKRAEEERERVRRLESHLAHTNRLSMLGELTASLAHEINQPIGAVVASAGAGLRWLDREQPELQRVREAIERIKDDGKRAADIISGLRAFYRKEGSPQRTLLDVNEVVREMLVLLRRESERHGIVMRTQLAPGLPAVRADRVQLQQVLMNLMVNGMEAMGDAGGELSITTRREDHAVHVSVSDTGVGIPAEQVEQIFSAFVTSKPSGTGLGLAISRTIIDAHEGRLWAEANSGRGATFHFTLPVDTGPTETPSR